MDTIKIYPHHKIDIKELKIDGNNQILTGTTITGIIPGFIGQIFITNDGLIFIAKGISADTDWVQVSNPVV
jgi:hypothetical protein